MVDVKAKDDDQVVDEEAVTPKSLKLLLLSKKTMISVTPQTAFRVID